MLSLPKVLLFTFIFVGIGFITSTLIVVSQTRSNEEEYQKLIRTFSLRTPKVKRNLRNSQDNYGATMEQPTRQRLREDGVKTYVMIDGRLIDNNDLWQAPQPKDFPQPIASSY